MAIKNLKSVGDTNLTGIRLPGNFAYSKVSVKEIVPNKRYNSIEDLYDNLELLLPIEIDQNEFIFNSDKIQLDIVDFTRTGTKFSPMSSVRNMSDVNKLLNIDENLVKNEKAKNLLLSIKKFIRDVRGDRSILTNNIKNRKKYKKQWDEFKASQKCSHCGMQHPAVIDFHHVVRSKDNPKVNQLIKNKRYRAAMEEVNKCVPLCANCHRILHWSEELLKKKKRKRKLLNSIRS